ncbi:hypothetical protein [Moorena producens]|uniref:hypothetical protein n=1 Tax=Moorena producens TaxID=1155739 RepID=UPI0011EA6CBC|nr:hypothetical protein [Moorena producens]
MFFNLQPWPLATLREQPPTLAFGHATRTTLAFGHATRTTSKPWPLATLREQPPNLGLWPRYANNIHPSTVSFSTNYHIPNP